MYVCVCHTRTDREVMLVFFLFFLSSPVVLLVVSRSWLSAISKTAFCEEGKRNTRVHTHTHTHIHTESHIQSHTHAHTHTHTHTNTHTHVHTHTHTYTWSIKYFTKLAISQQPYMLRQNGLYLFVKLMMVSLLI